MIPQYAKSTDPEVIAAIEANDATRKEFGQAAREFVLKYATGYQAGSFYGGNDLGSGWRVSAIASHAKPTSGQWTTGYKGRGWRPYKSNPAAKEMEGLTRLAQPVPGSPGIVSVPGPDFTSYWLTPQFFVFKGAAYMGFGRNPSGAEHSDHEVGAQWTEILASSWHLAYEGWVASLKAEETKA